MLLTLIKHKIADKCIDILFDKISNNFQLMPTLNSCWSTELKPHMDGMKIRCSVDDGSVYYGYIKYCFDTPMMYSFNEDYMGSLDFDAQWIEFI
jgi:hypothetical protein